MSPDIVALHHYDLLLCKYAVETIGGCLLRNYLHKQMVEVWATKSELWRLVLSDDLEDFLGKPTETGGEGKAPDLLPGLLLNPSEFQTLSCALNLSAHHWTPYPFVHDRHLSCVLALKKLFTTSIADDWSARSIEFGRLLTSPRLPLLDGIDYMADWTRLLQSYLRQLNAVDFLPRPQGKYPTPTTVKGSGLHLSEVEGGFSKSRVDRIRKVIAGSTRKEHPKSSVIVRESNMARQEALAILRYLETRGEYKGFVRKRSL